MRNQSIILLAAIVLAAGCEAADDADAASAGSVGEEAAVSAGPASEEAAALLDEAANDLAGALFLRADVFEDYDEAIAVAERVGGVLDDLAAELPEGGEVGAEQRDEYEAVLDAIAEWRLAADATATELADQRPELEPEMAEWAGVEFTEQPPSEFLVVMNRFAASFDLVHQAGGPFGDACAGFAVAADLVIDCYAFAAPPVDGVEGDPGASGDLQLSGELVRVGDVVLELDWYQGLYGREDLDERTVIGMTPVDELTIGAAPEVVDPASTPTEDALEASIAWPDDPVSWYEELPVDVLDAGERDLGERTWGYAAMSASNQMALLAWSAEAPIEVGPDSPVVLFWTEIEGETIVAVATTGRGAPPEGMINETSAMLTALTPQ